MASYGACLGDDLGASLSERDEDRGKGVFVCRRKRGGGSGGVCVEAVLREARVVAGEGYVGGGDALVNGGRGNDENMGDDH